MLDGDYSDLEAPSAAPPPHVDPEQVVEAINERLGADYSGKFCLSAFIQYNATKFAPLTSKKGSKQTRTDSKKFDRSKGYSKQFSQAVFGFARSIIPSA
jgi:hypothetical protein